MDQEIPDYDMDSEDDTWLTEQSKKMEITPLKFEEMMDRLEKGSGQQVVYFVLNHHLLFVIFLLINETTKYPVGTKMIFAVSGGSD